MLHHDLRFELFIEFERYAYDDQHTRRAERVGHTDRLSERVEAESRNYRYEREEQCAEQGNTAVYLRKIFAGRLAGSYALDRAAVLLQVSRNVYRIELYLRVEVCEEDYEDKREYIVDRGACAEVLHVEQHYRVVLREEGEDHLREHQERRSEDDGHNAARIDLHRDVGGLTAVHLVTFDLLCVVYLYPAFAAVDKDDEQEHNQYEDKISEDIPYIVGLVAESAERAYERSREGCNDTDKDYHRRTVADTVFGNSLAEPHDQRGACGKDKNDYRAADGFTAERGFDCAGVVEGDHYTDTLYDREKYRYVSRDLGYLRATCVPVFAHSFERGDYQCQQLHYDEAVDERQNA